MARKRLTDFGGKTAAGGGKKSAVLEGQNLISTRCLSCNKLNYVSYVEYQRAAAPRCTACGGGLMEIEESYKRRTGCSYAKAEKMVRGLGEKPFTCPTCREKFRSAVALGLHSRERHPEAEPINAKELELRHGYTRRHTN